MIVKLELPHNSLGLEVTLQDDKGEHKLTRKFTHLDIYHHNYNIPSDQFTDYFQDDNIRDKVWDLKIKKYVKKDPEWSVFNEWEEPPRVSSGLKDTMKSLFANSEFIQKIILTHEDEFWLSAMELSQRYECPPEIIDTILYYLKEPIDEIEKYVSKKIDGMYELTYNFDENIG